MGTNTGDGGFSVDGQTLTFDLGDPDAPGIEPKPTDHGDIHVDDTPKDISKRTKLTIAQYLSGLTKKNDFPLDNTPTEVSTETHDGVPSPLSDTQNSSFFVPRNDVTQPFDITQQQRSGNRLFDHVTDPAASLKLSKGKASPQLPDGNKVLQQVKGGTPGKLPDAIAGYSSVVLSNNRFSDASRMGGSTTLTHPTFGDVSLGRLAQVGVALSIRASQELNAADAANDPSSGGQEARSLLPGFAQIGSSRVDLAVLEAKDVLQTLTNDEIPDGDIISIAPEGSWGTMNNVEDPFSGITALGMIALSVALTAAIVVLFEGLGFILSLVKGGSASGAAKSIEGRYVLGRYTVDKQTDPNAFPPTSFPPDLGALLGIRPTVHPFSSALQTGTAAFFGIDTSNGLLGQLVSGLTSATQNPGFNSVVARSIIRSSVTVIDQLKKAFSSPNLIAGVKNVLSIVDVIRASKLIGAMNVFATLGDQILVDDLKDEVVDGAPGEPVKKSRIDKLDDSAPAQMKNRLSNTLKLAWSSNRSPSSYLVPDSFVTFAATAGRLGGFQTGLGLQNEKARNYFKVQSLSDQLKNGPRIPYDSANPEDITVKSMEGLLEAEYFPFYFHDLRTNEITSFHAFLTQLSDDYTVNWENTEAYGRVDPVKVYRSTTRAINVGFYVVSTSQEDHDDMWAKINKLTTLVYPQYTAGRLLSDSTGDNQFIQPFSQLISASPLIRMRLGDVIKSNYSRFALARLFGADQNIMKLGGNKLDSFKDGVAGLQKVQSALQKDVQDPTGKDFTLDMNNMPKPDDSGGVSVGLPGIPGITTGDKPSHSPNFTIAPGDAAFFLFTVSKTLSGNAVIVVPSIMSAQDMQDLFGMTATAASNTQQYLKTEYDNSNKPIKRVVGGQYVAPINALRMSPKRFRSLLDTSFTGAEANIDQLTDFLSPDKNAIVKSFQQTRGKGLAGTINSMNMDMYDRVVYEVAPGRRAPMFCKITISFSPIHDISPGLDVNGMNRAPIYPVGYSGNGADVLKENS